MTKKTPPVEVNKEDYERFQSLHPQHGAWTWFIKTALAKYVRLHAVDTDELLDIAIRDIKLKDS